MNKNISFALDVELHGRISKYARRKKCTIAQALRELIAKHVLPDRDTTQVVLSVPQGLGREQLEQWLTARIPGIVNALTT